MKKMAGLILTVIAVLSGCAQASGGNDGFTDETYIPAGWTYEKPETMLVLGNSICRHPERIDIDWTGEYGMWASSAEKDYVHLLAGKLGCTVTARNSWDIEQTYETYDFSALPDGDMIIIQLGDNMANHHAGYAAHLEKLVARYEGSTVVLVSTILDNNKLAPVDAETQKAARDCGVPYIDLRDIMTNDANVGVMYHPNDSGMALIADGIYSAIVQYEAEK